MKLALELRGQGLERCDSPLLRTDVVVLDSVYWAPLPTGSAHSHTRQQSNQDREAAKDGRLGNRSRYSARPGAGQQAHADGSIGIRRHLSRLDLDSSKGSICILRPVVGVAGRTMLWRRFPIGTICGDVRYLVL